MQSLAVAAAKVLAVQSGTGMDVDVTLGQGLTGGAVGAFLTTLVVGAIAVAMFPERTEELMAAVLENPLGSFVYGIVVLVGVFVVALLFAITIVGIVVAAPLLLVAYVLWAVGSAIASLAIADRLVGREDGWLKPLVVAALINGVLAATGVGSLLAIAIGAAGFGTVVKPYLG